MNSDNLCLDHNMTAMLQNYSFNKYNVLRLNLFLAIIIGINFDSVEQW